MSAPVQISKLKEYAGHGFKYGGASSQINKMKMKEKQAGKLEEAAAEQESEVVSANSLSLITIPRRIPDH